MKASDLFDVTGRVCVVTGGTRGIGLDMARVLCANGAEVIVSSRKADAVEAATKELSDLGTAHGIAADLGTREGIEALNAIRAVLDDHDGTLVVHGDSVRIGETTRLEAGPAEDSEDSTVDVDHDDAVMD